MEKDERLAKVETNVEWLVKTVAKMEPKLDHLIEKNSFQWGKVIGACLAVEVIVSAAVQMIFKH